MRISLPRGGEQRQASRYTSTSLQGTESVRRLHPDKVDKRWENYSHAAGDPRGGGVLVTGGTGRRVSGGP